MADIFLSYKREDRDLVEALAKALEDDGLSVWWDTDLPLGKSYASSISSALMAAKVVIPVWTARSIQSEWVQEEATAGKKRGALIPLRLEAVEPPIGFGMIQTADLSGWTPGDTSHPEWIKLTESVRAMIAARAATTPVSPPSVAPIPPRPRKKPLPVLKLAIAAVAVVVVGVGVYFGLQQRGTDSPETVASALPEPSAAAPVQSFSPTPINEAAEIPNKPAPALSTPAETASAKPSAPVEIPAPSKLAVDEVPNQPAEVPSKLAAPDPGSFETAAGSQPAVRTPQGNPGEILYQTDQGIAVNDFVFAPDGKTALSAGHDGTVRLLDAATGKELRLFAGFGPYIVQAAYSRTGSHAVIGASDSSITFVDLASGEEAGRFQTPGYLYRMAVSPDDGSIAVLNNESEVRIYQADGVLLTQFTGKLSPNVYGIAWCPESDCLLVWGKAGMLEVWDPFKPALVDTLRGHAGVVRAAAFSPDGKRFATVADDKQVLIWDATNGKRVRALTGLKEAPMALAWGPRGKRLAVETKSAKAFVWTAADGKPPVVVGPDRGLGKEWVAFTPDGKSVVLGGRRGPVATRIPD